MLSARCYRNSVCLSVCPSDTRVDQSKTAEVRIMQFSPHSSRIPLGFARYVSSRNSDGFPLSGGVKQGWDGENKLFSSCMRQYLENGTRYTSKVTILMTNRKLHMHFRLAPRSITLDDLELLKVRIFISHDFADLRGNNGKTKEDRHVLSALNVLFSYA